VAKGGGQVVDEGAEGGVVGRSLGHHRAGTSCGGGLGVGDWEDGRRCGRHGFRERKVRYWF